MNKHHLRLSDTDRTTLEALLAKGTLSARTFKRATALLELHRGKTFNAVAQTLDLTSDTVSIWCKNYLASGLACLHDAPRSGRPISIDGSQRAKITALACSDAPLGHDRWTLRLLAEKAVEAGFVEHLSHSFVGQVLKKTN